MDIVQYIFNWFKNFTTQTTQSSEIRLLHINFSTFDFLELFVDFDVL